MRYPQRRMETPAAEAGSPAAVRDRRSIGRDGVGAHFEAGDAFAWRGELVVGYGPRTEELALKHLATDLGVSVRGVRITHPGMYHMDIGFCPLDETRAMVCPAAYDEASAAALLDLVPEPLVLTEEEGLTFCANSIVLGRTIVMPACPTGCATSSRSGASRSWSSRSASSSRVAVPIRCLTNPLDVRLGRDLAPVTGGRVTAARWSADPDGTRWSAYRDSMLSHVRRQRLARARSPRSRPTSPASRPRRARASGSTSCRPTRTPTRRCPASSRRAEAAVAVMNRYPDMGNTALYAALSERLGVPAERLAAGTGSVAVLYHLLQAFCDPGDEVVYAWRSFEAYPIAVSATGAVSVQVPVDADGRHDLDAMAAAVTDTHQGRRRVYAEQPDRSVGDRRPSCARSSSRCPTHVLVVVDEAYREFVREDDPVDGLALAAAHAERRRDAHLRQGLRAGRLPGRLRRRATRRSRPPCVPVRCRSASPASPRPPRSRASPPRTSCWSASSRSSRERDRVVDGAARPGLDRSRSRRATSSGCRSASARADFAALAEEAGITVRPFAGEGVRVTIGEPEANDVFLR